MSKKGNKRKDIRQIRDVREILEAMESYVADREENPLDVIGSGNLKNIRNFIHFVGDKYSIEVNDVIKESDASWSYLKICQFMDIEGEFSGLDFEDIMVYDVNASREYSCLDKSMCLVAEYMASDRCQDKRYYMELYYLNRQIFR